MIEFAIASALRADLAYRIGDLAAADEEARAAVRAAGGDLILVMLLALTPLIDTLIDRGDLGEAQRVLDSADAAMSAHQEMVQNHALEARGRLRVSQGRIQEGLADLLSVGRWCEGWGGCNPGMFAWRSSAALAHLQLGDEARDVVQPVGAHGR